jgi:hypothetical protein
MCCLWVTNFCLFLHNILNTCLSAGLAHLSHLVYRQLDAECLVLKLQTGLSLPPIFRSIRLQQLDHSFRYSLCFASVAIMALCRNVLQEDNILCELYVDTRSDVSDYSDSENLARYSDAPQPVHINNCDLLLVHWPHNFHTYFSSHWVGWIFLSPVKA